MNPDVNSPRPGLLSGFLLLGPFILCFALFWLMPLLWGLDLSLRSNGLYGPGDYIGLENYRFIMEDPLDKRAIQNTAVYTVGSIALIIPLGFLLAHFIRQSVKGLQPILTFCILLPGLTPPAVLSILFLLFFHGDQGILNRFLIIPFGLEPINWIHDPQFIMTSLIFQSVWRWTGFIAFFFLCGMEALPKTYIEAAKVEGCSGIRTLIHVILPLIKHIIIFAVIFLFVDAFSMFSGAYSLLGGSGGPSNAGLLLVTHVYHTAFVKGNFGDSAAIVFSISPILLIIISWITFRSRSKSIKNQ